MRLQREREREREQERERERFALLDESRLEASTQMIDTDSYIPQQHNSCTALRDTGQMRDDCEHRECGYHFMLLVPSFA